MGRLTDSFRDQVRGGWYGTTVLAIGAVLYLIYLIAADEPPNNAVFLLIVFVSVAFGALRYEGPKCVEAIPLWDDAVVLAVMAGVGMFLTLIAGHQLTSTKVIIWPVLLMFVFLLRCIRRLFGRARRVPDPV